MSRLRRRFTKEEKLQIVKESLEEGVSIVNGLSEQLPSKIEHLVDTDLDPKSGECSYFYNYLLYTFKHMDTLITARSYMDDVSEVSFLQCPADHEVVDVGIHSCTCPLLFYYGASVCPSYKRARAVMEQPATLSVFSVELCNENTQRTNSTI